MVKKAEAKVLIHTLLADLKACRDKNTGKHIHATAIRSVLESDTFISNTLVSMYARSGSIQDSQLIFDTMHSPDVVSWNALIMGYVENDREATALSLFSSMPHGSCLHPDSRSFLAALKACSSLASKYKGSRCVSGCEVVLPDILKKGRELHSKVASYEAVMDIYIGNMIVDMYAKCSSMCDSKAVFDRMPVHSVVSWTALILGYAENGEEEVAIELFSVMRPEPNPLTILAVLKACSCLAAREEGILFDGKLVKMKSFTKGVEVHETARSHGFDSEVIVANTLVDMYAKCGSLVDAQEVFNSMKERTVATWNILMLGYVDNGDAEVALKLFDQMRTEGEYLPDVRTFVAVLKACTSLASKERRVLGMKPTLLMKGKDIELQAKTNSFDSDVYVTSALVDMYAKCGSMVDAKRIFDGIVHPDVILWTALILGYAENGEERVALELFDVMQREGCEPNHRTIVAALKACASLAANQDEEALEKGRLIHLKAQEGQSESDVYVMNTLVDMYAKCRSMQDAQEVFDKMQKRDVVSWTALISGYMENDEGQTALELFWAVKQEGKCEPNALTLGAALKACGNMACLEDTKDIHMETCKRGLELSPVLATDLVDVYGKCGSTVEAQVVFDSLSALDTVTCTALIAGYSRQGDSDRVFELFFAMSEEGLNPNAVTFVSLLSMCSHVGYVEKGKELFDIISTKYGVSPEREHYACVVDMLGRSNRLEDAVSVVEMMPGEPGSLVWRTILSACTKWKNVQVGRMAFESMLRIDKNDEAAYSLMSNLFGSLGMWEEQVEVDNMRKFNIYLHGSNIH